MEFGRMDRLSRLAHHWCLLLALIDGDVDSSNWCGLAHKWHQARLYISAKIIYFLIRQLCLRVDAVDDRKVVVKVKVIAGVEFDIGGPVAILHEAAKDLVRLCRGLDSDENGSGGRLAVVLSEVSIGPIRIACFNGEILLNRLITARPSRGYLRLEW